MTTAGVPVATGPMRWPGARSARRVGGFLVQHPEVLTAVLCAVVLAIGQRGPDLPAQTYRVFLYREHGLVAFDSHWYAGHPLPGYSLIFPPLASFIGPRLLGALSCVAATAAFTRLLRGQRRTGHDLAVLWFAVVSVVDLVVGRLPFALGLAFGLAALVTARDGRRWAAWPLAIATGCASPLAGAFLLLAAVAWLPEAGWRRALPLSGAGVGIAAAAAFGEGGWFPFPATTLLVVLLLSVGGLVVVPRSSRFVRRGLLLYGLASIVLFPWHNPIGGNMVRLGAVFGGPLIAYELWRSGGWRRKFLPVAAIPLLIWQFAPLPTSFANGQDNESAHPDYYAGLLAYLHAHDADRSRLEVPLTDGRWESFFLATEISLARGWERQPDLARNSVLYDEELTAEDYHAWLLDNGVRWVALPDVGLDASEDGEAAILNGTTPSFLQPVWRDAHWRLWEVRDARPLVTGAASLVHLGVSTIDLQGERVGTAVLLVRWTRFWRVASGDACGAPNGDGWTALQVRSPGPIRLSADVGFGSIAGDGRNGSCNDDGD
jgi:hypothetical protein